MSRRVSIRKMPARPTAEKRKGALLFALVNHEAPKLCNSSFIRSPGFCVLAWRVPEKNAMHGKLRMSHSLLSVAMKYSRKQNCSHCHRIAWASSYIRFSYSGFFRKRHLSRIPPCLTRSLARCFSRARRQLRGSALPIWAPYGFRLSKILLCKRRKKDFPNLPKKTPLDLGSGADSRHFVQECPE